MITWLLAVAGGAVVAWLAYGRLGKTRPAPASRGGLFPILLAALRGAAAALLLAVLLGAPAGPARVAGPLPVLDASASWLRGSGSTGNSGTSAWAAALDSLRSLSGDSVLVAGDSLRILSRREALALEPTDNASRIQPALDRAVALGRAVAVISDGEWDDAAAANALPPGSRVVPVAVAPTSDLAVASLDMPAEASEGDTITVSALVVAGPAGSTAGRATIMLAPAAGAGAPQVINLAPLEPFASRRLDWRVPVTGTEGARTVTVAISAESDAEPRNDTLVGVLEVSTRPRAVFVSTAPDLDVREVLRTLRGALAVPVRAYLRVTPTAWREEGTLAPVAEAEVQRRAREAGLLIVHGDTAWGGPAMASRRARVLWQPAPPLAPPAAGEVARAVEWFVDAPPVSPISAVLPAFPVESLAPLAVPPAAVTTPAAPAPTAAPATGASPAADGRVPVLRARLGRAGNPVTIISARESERGRDMRVMGSGFATWAIRGGRPADAFTALWGGIFDWVAQAREEEASTRPVAAVLRAGERVQWRLGRDLTGAEQGEPSDSSMPVIRPTYLRLRASTTRTPGAADASAPGAAAPGTIDSVRVSLVDGAGGVVDSDGLREGVWEVLAIDGAAGRRIVVNPSREWVPRTPVAVAAVPPARARAADAPSVFDHSWPYILVLLLVSAEWLLRRYAGLR